MYVFIQVSLLRYLLAGYDVPVQRVYENVIIGVQSHGQYRAFDKTCKQSDRRRQRYHSSVSILSDN